MYRQSIYYVICAAMVVGLLSADLTGIVSGADLSDGSVQLAWSPSVSPEVIGYNIYYGLASGEYATLIPVGNAGSVSISNLVRGTYYYFAATSLDSSGQESLFSNEAVYWVPRAQIPSQAVAGAYRGLFYEAAQVRQNSAGALALEVTPSGAYSGVVQIGGSRFSFHGHLNSFGQSTNLVTRRAARSLQLQLSVGAGAQGDGLFGSVSDGTWQATLTGSRAVFNARSNPSPYAGNYDLVFPGWSGNSSLPAGNSFAAVKVSSSGAVAMAAKLADGTTASQGTFISSQGTWPLYSPLYSGNGSLVSWINSTGQLAGTLSWIKPTMSKARYYPAGFTNQCQVLGSLYSSKTVANCPGNCGNAAVEFSGGDLPSNFTNAIATPTQSAASGEGANMVFRFTRSSGVFSGTTATSAGSTRLPFYGVLLQNIGMGYGFLLGANQTSQALIESWP
jgi:hypothetical protein